MPAARAGLRFTPRRSRGLRSAASFLLLGLLLAGCGGGAGPAALSPAPTSPAPSASQDPEASSAARTDTLPPLLGATAESFERPGHSPADVAFMHGMIPHHAQALRMAALVPDRTSNGQLHIMAERMAVAQGDEIALMRDWLEQVGEPLPPADAGHAHAGHGDAGHGGAAHGDDAHGAMDHRELMPGMLSEDDFELLAAARDEAFDRLFLEFMIRHHEGAIVMVNELFAAPGAAQEDFVYKLASDVYADQTTEIHFMRIMLDRIPPRP